MTPEKKQYDEIRKKIIEQDGERFLRLSEKDQHNIILASIRGIEEMKKGTT